MPATACPGCGEVLDGAFEATGRRPSGGDLSICAYCGSVNQFTAQLGLEQMSERELSALPVDVRKAIQETRRLLRAAERPPMPAGYTACCNEIARLIPQWIERQCITRTLDLQWHRWEKTVFAGSIDGERAKYLAASPDAMELLHYLDEKTGGQATLLMAKVVLEALGIKNREDN